MHTYIYAGSDNACIHLLSRRQVSSYVVQSQSDFTWYGECLSGRCTLMPSRLCPNYGPCPSNKVTVTRTECNGGNATKTTTSRVSIPKQGEQWRRVCSYSTVYLSAHSPVLKTANSNSNSDYYLDNDGQEVIFLDKRNYLQINGKQYFIEQQQHWSASDTTQWDVVCLSPAVPSDTVPPGD